MNDQETVPAVVAAEEALSPAAQAAAAAATQDFTKRRCILENGIELGIKPVPQTILRRVAGAIPEPPVPTITLGDGTVQEWPGDPDYDAALAACYQQRIEAAVDKLYVLGSFVESVPDGMFRPLDDGWVEELRSIGVEVDTSTGLKRYSEWLQLYAVTTQNDQSALYMHCVAACGLLDWEVRKAIEFFLRRKIRAAADEGAAEPGDRDGDNVLEGVPGTDLGIRGEGGGEVSPVDVDGVVEPPA